MDKYYINISNKEEFDIWVKLLESLWYKMYNGYIDDITNWCLKYWNIIWSEDWMIRFASKFNQLNHEWYIFLSLLKVWSLVTIWNNKTVYKIETISKNVATIVNLKTRNRYDYKLDKLKLYTWTDTVEWSSTFKEWDTVKVINVWRICSYYEEAAKSIWLTKFIRINWLLTSEQKESITNNNYYRVVWFHYNQSKNEYVWIENILDWKQYIINPEWLEHINLSWNVLSWTSNLQNQLYTNTATAFAYALESTVAWTATWCIDYPISYIDTSQVSEYITCTWEIKRNTLLTNNNTMEILNKLRADKFFSKESNLVSIEYLDALLKRSINLVEDTKQELDKVQSKLIWLNKKLESATNNQDVAMLKDLIESTKVIQEFVDELKDKTISKFETAKTKFDVAGYLKD